MRSLSATWDLGTNSAIPLGPRKTTENLHRALCGLVVRVPGYRSRGLGSISGATRLSEK
jgi:hypothetical protein